MVSALAATIFRPFFDHFLTIVPEAAPEPPQTIFLPFFDHVFLTTPEPFFHHFCYSPISALCRRTGAS